MCLAGGGDGAGAGKGLAGTAGARTGSRAGRGVVAASASGRRAAARGMMEWLCLGAIWACEARVVFVVVVLPSDKGRGGAGAGAWMVAAAACIGASGWIPAFRNSGGFGVLAIAARASGVDVSGLWVAAVAPFGGYVGASTGMGIS